MAIKITVPAVFAISAICIMAAAQAAEVLVKKMPGNIQGDVLLISVNNAPYPYDEAKRLFVTSAQDCEDQCMFTSGCAGWAYCSKPTGCGTGCRAYHKTTGPTPLPNAMGCTPAGVYLPMKSDEFRPGGMYPPYKPDPAVCTASDGWPQHTCTLKRNVPSPPQLYSGGIAEGWLSGTVDMPAACKGPNNKPQDFPMTAFECSVCLKSSDPTTCLTCSHDLFKDACGYTRGAFLRQTKADAIASVYRKSCLPCTCYVKPGDAEAKRKCFEAVKSIGVYTAKDYSTVDATLAAAAALCAKVQPSATPTKLNVTGK